MDLCGSSGRNSRALAAGVNTFGGRDSALCVVVAERCCGGGASTAIERLLKGASLDTPNNPPLESVECASRETSCELSTNSDMSSVRAPSSGSSARTSSVAADLNRCVNKPRVGNCTQPIAPHTLNSPTTTHRPRHFMACPWPPRHIPARHARREGRDGIGFRQIASRPACGSGRGRTASRGQVFKFHFWLRELRAI